MPADSVPTDAQPRLVPHYKVSDKVENWKTLLVGRLVVATVLGCAVAAAFVIFVEYNPGEIFAPASAGAADGFSSDAVITTSRCELQGCSGAAEPDVFGAVGFVSQPSAAIPLIAEALHGPWADADRYDLAIGEMIYPLPTTGLLPQELLPPGPYDVTITPETFMGEPNRGGLVEPPTAAVPPVEEAAANQPTQPSVIVKAPLAYLKTILTHAVIKAWSDDRRTRGLRFTAISEMPEAQKVGLVEGDVIVAVNGQKLTSKQKAYQVFMEARSLPRINIELLRDGSPRHFVFIPN